MKNYRVAGALAAAALTLVVIAGRALACPFCSAPSLTLTEQVAQSDAVVLVTWVDATRPAPPATTSVGSGDGEAAVATATTASGSPMAETIFAVEKVVKYAGEAPKKGARIALPRYLAAKKGDLFLLMGNKGTSIDWATPLEVSQTSFEYIAGAPAPEDPVAQRLEYFLEYLEFPDQLVANDAYGEFANAPYEDIAKLADKMPRERIRKWVASEDTPPTRMGLYGLLMGLCGNADDAKLMERIITEPTSEFRLGIDGVISGYLLLTGGKGLEVVDRTKLASKVVVDAEGNPVLDDKGQKQPVPFSETYAAMQALRFMWDFGGETVSKDRLQESMRTLLDRSELADLVIADLARWQDWSVQDRLMKLYGTEGYDIPSVKRAVVRYLLVCSRDKGEGADAKVPEHAAKAQAHLDELRKTDPRTVRDAERFFFPQ
ncbi:MAG: hypothetical protein KY476_02970 [Planctomycetes bacterium]|nr:hypothetical protein [Planctomycetota bacterium]